VNRIHILDSPFQYIQAKMRFANEIHGCISQQDYPVYHRVSDVREVQVNRVFARSRLAMSGRAEYRIEFVKCRVTLISEEHLITYLEVQFNRPSLLLGVSVFGGTDN